MHPSCRRGNRIAPTGDTETPTTQNTETTEASEHPTVLTLVQTALEGVSPASARTGLTIVSVRALPAASILLVAALAPFEIPLFTAGPLTLTTVELAALAAIVVSLAAILYAGGRIVWPAPLTWPAIACLVVLVLTAALSPVDRGNALRFAARMMMAGALCLAVVNVVTTRELARAVVRVMLAVGVIVSVIAVLEVAQVRSVLSALTLFRPGFHVVGGQLRATSTLFYPTITSMYLEVVFVLGLWLLLEPRKGRPIVFAALAIVGAGIIATFTRAGLMAMGNAIALVAVLHFVKTRRLDRNHLRLAALAGTLTALVLLSRSPEILLTRLRTEGSQDWYGATYSAPATLQLRTGEDYQVPVTLENTGRVIWDSSTDPMFAVSYHWLRADTEAVVQFDGWRTPFPSPVEPNTRVTLPVSLRAPGAPGTYVLVWDVVHEHRAWLSTEGVTPARTMVTVEGERVSASTSEMPRLPAANRRPDRLTLWRAAIAVAADYPLLGVGPDNFRQVWGNYVAGTGHGDSRVHANNMYLELLTGAGIAGLGALLWLVVASGLALFAHWHQLPVTQPAAAAVFCGLWLVVAGHGLVDTFLSFTTTYVMFALAAGLAFSEYGHANRV